MRCWACSEMIEPTDEVNTLPIISTPVHRACYVRVTGSEPPASDCLASWCTRFREAA